MCANYLATLDRDELLRGFETLREDLDESKQEKRHFRKLYEETKKRLEEVESERDVYQQHGLTLEERLEVVESENARLLHELEAHRISRRTAELQIKRSRSPSLELIDRPAAAPVTTKIKTPAKAEIAAQPATPPVGIRSQVVRGYTLQKRKADSTALPTAKKPRPPTANDPEPQIPMQVAAPGEVLTNGTIQGPESDDDEYMPEDESEAESRNARWRRDKVAIDPERELEPYKTPCKRCSETPGQKCYKQKRQSRGLNDIRHLKSACFGCYIRKQACSHSSVG